MLAKQGFLGLGDAVWYVIMVPACCSPSLPLRRVAQHGYVKTAVRSFIKLAQKRCQKLGRELPKWCSKAGNLFFSSFLGAALVRMLCLACVQWVGTAHKEPGVVLGQWCRNRLLLCNTENGQFLPSRDGMAGLIASLRSNGSTYWRTGS